MVDPEFVQDLRGDLRILLEDRRDREAHRRRMMYDFRALVARHATALPNLRTTLARIERARDENPDVDKAALRCDFCERPYRLAVDGIRFCKRHAEEADVRPHGKIGG